MVYGLYIGEIVSSFHVLVKGLEHPEVLVCFVAHRHLKITTKPTHDHFATIFISDNKRASLRSSGLLTHAIHSIRQRSATSKLDDFSGALVPIAAL